MDPSFPIRGRLSFIRRLGEDWRDLAACLNIPVHDIRRFERGQEPVGIWAWLEDREQHYRLPEALKLVGRDDLAQDLVGEDRRSWIPHRPHLEPIQAPEGNSPSRPVRPEGGQDVVATFSGPIAADHDSPACVLVEDTLNADARLTALPVSVLLDRSDAAEVLTAAGLPVDAMPARPDTSPDKRIAALYAATIAVLAGLVAIAVLYGREWLADIAAPSAPATHYTGPVDIKPRYGLDLDDPGGDIERDLFMPDRLTLQANNNSKLALLPGPAPVAYGTC